MDPQLIDLLWEVTARSAPSRRSGSSAASARPRPIPCCAGVPAASLNSASTRWARRSTSTFPACRSRSCAAGLRAQRGGVGFYPTSGAPFVHLDTGSVRHWPRMPEEQLMAVLSKGQLKSYDGTAVAQATRMPSFLARLFGGGKDEDEDTATAAAAKPTVARAPAKPTTTATAETRVEKVAPCRFRKPSPPGRRPPTATRSPPPAPNRRRAGELRARVRERQARALGAEHGDGHADERIGKQHHQRARLLAGTSRRRGLAAGQWFAPAASAPRRAAAVASAQPATTASATPWPLTDRGGNEPIPNALAYAAQPPRSRPPAQCRWRSERRAPRRRRRRTPPWR